MKLKLTATLRQKLRGALSNLLFDLIDGDLNFPQETVAVLRDLADEIEAQNPAT